MEIEKEKALENFQVTQDWNIKFTLKDKFKILIGREVKAQAVLVVKDKPEVLNSTLIVKVA